MKKGRKSTTLEQGDFPFLHWSSKIIIHFIAKSLNGDAISLFILFPWSFGMTFFLGGFSIPTIGWGLARVVFILLVTCTKLHCRGGRGINCLIKHFKHFLLITQPPNYFPLLDVNQNPSYVEEGLSQISGISSSSLLTF